MNNRVHNILISALMISCIGTVDAVQVNEKNKHEKVVKTEALMLAEPTKKGWSVTAKVIAALAATGTIAAGIGIWLLYHRSKPEPIVPIVPMMPAVPVPLAPQPIIEQPIAEPILEQPIVAPEAAPAPIISEDRIPAGYAGEFTRRLMRNENFIEAMQDEEARRHMTFILGTEFFAIALNGDGRDPNPVYLRRNRNNLWNLLTGFELIDDPVNNWERRAQILERVRGFYEWGRTL